MQTSDNGHGYRTITLTFKIDNTTTKFKTVYIHRLVGFYFNYQGYIRAKETFDNFEINHRDSNKENNTISNLEWISAKENEKYRITNNKDKNVGQNHYRASEPDEKVIEVC